MDLSYQEYGDRIASFAQARTRTPKAVKGVDAAGDLVNINGKAGTFTLSRPLFTTYIRGAIRRLETEQAGLLSSIRLDLIGAASCHFIAPAVHGRVRTALTKLSELRLQLEAAEAALLSVRRQRLSTTSRLQNELRDLRARRETVNAEEFVTLTQQILRISASLDDLYENETRGDDDFLITRNPTLKPSGNVGTIAVRLQ